jgi:very-short-patch-repair endonuclease
MAREEALATIAARQYTLFTSAQARHCGFSEKQVRHRLGIGLWIEARRSVLGIAGAPTSWERTVMAALLAAGDGAAASHFTAAALWEFPHVLREEIELTTDRPDQKRLRGVTTHRTVAFLECEHTVHQGLPVTTVARTLVDLSARLSRFQLAQAFDKALRQGTTSLRAVRRCVGGLKPCPGRRPTVIRELLADRVPGYDPGDSDSEMRVVRILVDAGLPEPRQQHVVRLSGHRFFLDIAYPELKLAVEYDGWDSHRTRTSFDHDRLRANLLVADGWTVLRFTSAMTNKQIADVTQSTFRRLANRPRPR